MNDKDKNVFEQCIDFGKLPMLSSFHSKSVLKINLPRHPSANAKYTVTV